MGGKQAEETVPKIRSVLISVLLPHIGGKLRSNLGVRRVRAYRPLKFCHISTFYPPWSFGGDALYLYRLANALARDGHEVHVIHCLDSYHALKQRPPADPFPNETGVTLHSLRRGWGMLSPLLSQQTGRPWLKGNSIRRILASQDFDVLHFHNISLFGPRVLEIPTTNPAAIKLYTMHEHWLVCPMHVLWKNNERICDQPACIRCSLAFRRPPQLWRYTGLMEKSLDSVDGFLSPSDSTREVHYQHGFRREIERLPLFVPDPQTSEANKYERPYFLFVGRLERIKGLQEIIPVFRERPEFDLLIAGAGSYEPQLRLLAGNSGNIKFLGWVPQSRLAPLYSGATALLVPSICYEVFGLTVVEAFAHGTPAIVSALGSLQELVNESEAGFVYRNAAELLTSLHRLHDDPHLRQRMGANGYRAFLAKWSEEAHLDAYFQLLASVSRRKNGTVPWQQSATLHAAARS